jgi:glycosyltransferase involved in cell wall biosynthesis
MFLSIGIPTFNREKVIQENILHILQDNFLSENNINLIVSDNKSDDSTFQIINCIKNGLGNPKNIILNQNKENIGVFKNIFKIFELCETKYLLITSDEEFIIKNNIPALIEFLHEEMPTFVSPQMFIEGELYRGSKITKKIPASSWEQAGFFTSGLVFDVQKTKHIIDKYYKYLTADHIFYAQTLLICELMILYPRTQWFLNIPVVEQRHIEPTEISTNKKYRYWSVPGRWDGFLAVEKYFKTRAGEVSSEQAKKLIESFSRDNRRSLYNLFICAMKIESPQIITDFRMGVLYWEFRNSVLGKVLSALRRPNKILPYLARKLGEK